MVRQGQRQPKIVIGWLETVDFPEWGVVGVKAKADTGARSSAIDVANLRELDAGHVRFDFVAHRLPNGDLDVVTVEARVSRRTLVRSSSGHPHDRLMVITPVRIGPITKEIEIGLVSRGRMRCRVLLGRTGLRGDFVVNPARHHVVSQRRPGAGPTLDRTSHTPQANRPRGDESEKGS